jgi:dihydroneopterin aldolase
MRFFALHGIGEQEHKVGNDYVVNVRAEYDISKSALSDDLNDTLNYVEMYNVVKQVVGETQELLERVTYKIGERILERFEGVTAVEVDLRKVNPPIGADFEGAGIQVRVVR